jgi:ParB family chromosome partitioning protein
MAELRNVDPRNLQPHPNPARRTPASPAMDDQLFASIKAIGIIQPPIVVESDGTLVINAGHRRVTQAIRADFATIDVLVCEAGEALELMRALAENLIRASMTSVDIWRGIDALEQKGWNEPAIADAFALPMRTIKRLKLLAHLHPPMLDVMAAGNMPSEDQLRTIAAASREEQAQVWKKFKPGKGDDFHWYEVSRALSKRRIPFSAAKFGDNLAQSYGVVWEDDLFAPADEDGRYTTNVDGFFGAQQEWLQNNLPEKGALLPLDDYGRPQLPKKAEHVYGKPGKGDLIGHYLDPYSGDVKTTVYRLPDTKKPAKSDKNAGTTPDPEAPQPKTRPDVTQKGLAMIGDFRTDALHQALREAPIDSETLLALLVLAFAAENVDVRPPSDGYSRGARCEIAAALMVGGGLTADTLAIAKTARAMLAEVLSCQENASNSGAAAILAGAAIGADDYLPNFATEQFLPCLSRSQVEQAATDAGLPVRPKLRDTRTLLLDQFRDKRFIPSLARFTLSAGDSEHFTARHFIETDPSAPLGKADRDVDQSLGENEPADESQTDDEHDVPSGDGDFPEAA